MPKTRKDLADFTAWLERVRGNSPNTAKVYTSNVRRFLDEIDGRLTQGNVDAYFDSLSSNLYSGRLTGYNAWADFCEERIGVEMPRVTKSEERQNNTVKDPELPEGVREALRTLHKCAIPYKNITLMTWEDVEFTRGERPDFYHVRVPTEKGVVARADADAVDVIMEWGKPANEFAPFLPREPGSDQPYSLRGIQREVSIGQETLRERVARLRAEERKEQRGDVVTPQNYHTDYLPEVPAGQSAGALLGLEDAPAWKPAPSEPAPFEPAPFSTGSQRPKAARTEAPRHSGQAKEQKEQKEQKPKEVEPRPTTKLIQDLEEAKRAVAETVANLPKPTKNPSKRTPAEIMAEMQLDVEPNPRGGWIGSEQWVEFILASDYRPPERDWKEVKERNGGQCPACFDTGLIERTLKGKLYSMTCGCGVPVMVQLVNRVGREQERVSQAADLLGVDADKLAAVVALLNESKPQDKVMPPRFRIAEEATPIREKEPVEIDGELYDPNDPVYADLATDEVPFGDCGD